VVSRISIAHWKRLQPTQRLHDQAQQMREYDPPADQSLPNSGGEKPLAYPHVAKKLAADEYKR
jgi:hypothetical protein